MSRSGEKDAEEDGDPGTPEKGSGTRDVDFRYSCRNVEVAAQDRAGWSRVVCGLYSTGSDKAVLLLLSM